MTASTPPRATFPERRITFTDCYGEELTAKRTSAGEIRIYVNKEWAYIAPVEAEQLAHCLLAWAKEAGL
jgi:hypothetical protein